MSIQRIAPASDETGSSGSYEADFALRAACQSAHLAKRQIASLDRDNLAEGIATSGRSRERELLSRLTVQRGDLPDPLNQSQSQNQSLRSRNPGLLSRAYEPGRDNTLASFAHYEPEQRAIYRAMPPTETPCAVEDLLDGRFLPQPG